MQDLGKGRYELPLTHGVWISLSHWPRYLVGVIGCLVPVGLEDARLPHCQGGQGQVAERTQVQVPGITRTENNFATGQNQVSVSIFKLHLNSAEVMVGR